MSYDIHGTYPTAQEGVFFRRSLWAWPRLAALCRALVPEFADKCKYWAGTQGTGLSADAAAKLAERLHPLIADGTVADYIRQRHRKRARLLNIPCGDCDATGRIQRGLAKIMDDLPCPRTDEDSITCMACGGLGHRPPSAARRVLDEDDVRQWVAFLRSCGGFYVG